MKAAWWPLYSQIEWESGAGSCRFEGTKTVSTRSLLKGIAVKGKRMRASVTLQKDRLSGKCFC